MEFSLVFVVCLITTAAAQTTQSNPGCGNTSYYGPFGNISSPNHPGNYYDNLYCDYDVYAPTGSSLSFFFKSFNSEEGVDLVTISSPTNSSFSPKEYSGNSIPEPVSIPWCSQGRVNFRTDKSIVYSGFSLDYYVSTGGCGNTVYNDSNGYVTTPNYPSDYGYNQNCSNIIWAPQRSTFQLIFQSFNLHNCCNCDWMEISCRDTSTGPYKYCGNQSSIERNFYECSQLILWFHSDDSDNYPGFKIQYSVSPGSTVITSTNTATTTTVFVPPSSTASTSTTTASTTTVFVPQDCGDTSYYGPSGVISSPNHPGNYANDLFCDYYITASSSSSSIAIIFEALDTEECCDYVTISCPTNPIYPSWRYSGSTLPQPLSIPWCSAAVVNFFTGSSVVSTGFSLDYHISLGGCGDTVYTGSTGYVSSPNYPSDYDSNQNCSNIIWTRLSSSFSITFQYMKVEECCDFVELSCLDNAAYGTHRFTGTTIPPKQTIPQCTQVRVWFYSDDSVVDVGFSLEYTATPESDGQK